MIIAVELDRNIDLSLFSRFLHQSQIRHRINETGKNQVVWVDNEDDKARVIELYDRYARGEFSLEAAPQQASGPKPKNPIIAQLLNSPLTMTLILASIICFPITLGVDQGDFSDWFHSFSFLEFNVFGNRLHFATLQYTLDTGQYWRLLTPMFLHFGWMHIVFNLLWIWEIGKRIEWVNGALVVLLVVLTSSLAANVTQYELYGAGLFGGMSGVVYGLLGYSLTWSLLVPEKSTDLPKGIYVIMVALLALGFTGVIDLLQMGNIANGAHLGGFVAGFGIGLVSGGIEKLKSAKFQH